MTSVFTNLSAKYFLDNAVALAYPFYYEVFEKKKKPVYDTADQSFVASVLDALNLSHGDAVLEISKDSVLSESYFANRYGAYVKHLKTASEFTGGFLNSR